MLRIDKSLFNAEELAQYQALIAKAAVPVDDEDYEEDDGMEKEDEAFYQDEEQPAPKNPTAKACAPKTRKKAPSYADTQFYEPEEDEEEEDDDMTKSVMPPEVSAALARMQRLEKSIEMAKFTEIAKKYAPLGEKEDELAKTLYSLSKSNPQGYNAYISVLEKSLGLVKKSGLFAEIGKSATGSGSVTDKIEKAASEIRKSDPNMSYADSIAKAWTNNPDLISEYDQHYFEGR